MAWIATNESLLSGIAALVAVAGVVLTPIGFALRRRQRGEGGDAPASSSSTEAPRAAQAPSGDRPSLAVLPFTNLSDDSEQEFLADGMTEDLITGLAANRHLSVVARNSTFAYKGQSPDIRDVGRELGVRYVLEGSVRKIGDRMRTTAQLIEAATGEHLWADNYDRSYADVFAVQDEVVSAIAAALNAQLSRAEYERARRAPPNELGAWERVQKGMIGVFYITNSDSVRESLKLLREAVEIDPEYTYARAALAWTLYLANINGLNDDLRSFADEARTHLAAAMQGGHNDDPLTLYYAGGALLYSGRFDQAIGLLERSLAHNPNQFEVEVHIALAHAYLGNYEEAHRRIELARSLAPRSHLDDVFDWYGSKILGCEGRHAEALALVERFITRKSDYAAPRIEQGLYLDALGREEEGRAVIARVVETNPGLVFEGIALQIGAHADREVSVARIRRLRELWPGGASPRA